jgi:ribosomal RNA-processing protein 9
MAARLQTDILSHSPKMHIHIAGLLSLLPAIHFLPLPSLPPTAARVASGSPYLYTASKSGAIAKFSLPTGRLTQHFPRAGRAEKAKKGKGRERESTLGNEVQLEGHRDEIWDLALSQDGRFLVSGGKEGIVGVWDVEGEKGRWVRGLKGHRDSITVRSQAFLLRSLRRLWLLGAAVLIGFPHRHSCPSPQSLSFQLGTENFYTSSLDRTISIFSTSTLSHLESLYGHQDGAPSVSALRGENLVSAGSRDRTVRYWKVAEESQLVFRGGGASKGVWEDDDDVLDEQERKAVVEGREGEGRAKRERRKRREGKQKERFREGSIDCVAMVDEQHFISGGDSGCVMTLRCSGERAFLTRTDPHMPPALRPAPSPSGA